MKKTVPLLLIAFFVLASLFPISAQNALASPVDASGQSIQLIDGPDIDTAVTFQISDWQFNVIKDVYYAIDSGAWTEILFDFFGNAEVGPYAGGSFMDLAIDSNSSNTIDGGDLFSRSDATLTYSIEIAALNPQNPTRTQDYYKQVDVRWDLGPVVALKLDILVTNDCDGFAPAPAPIPAPVPGAIWLLGSGLFGFAVFRKKYKHKA